MAAACVEVEIDLGEGSAAEALGGAARAIASSSPAPGPWEFDGYFARVTRCTRHPCTFKCYMRAAGVHAHIATAHGKQQASNMVQHSA